MQQNYIKAPSEPDPIVIRKGKALDVKPATIDEVPESYRKTKYAKGKALLFEMILYYVGLTELIRKGFSL